MTPSLLFLGNCCTHTNFIVVLDRPATCPCVLTSSRASFGWGKADSILSIHPAIQPARGGREIRARGRTTKKKAKKMFIEGDSMLVAEGSQSLLRL